MSFSLLDGSEARFRKRSVAERLHPGALRQFLQFWLRRGSPTRVTGRHGLDAMRVKGV
jgi:hypothetical protein